MIIVEVLVVELVNICGVRSGKCPSIQRTRQWFLFCPENQSSRPPQRFDFLIS